MRITVSEKFFKENNLEIGGISANKQYIKEMYKKLAQLEDIEEELGFDLITLFKALKNGIVVCCNNTFGGERNVFVNLTPDRLSIEYKWKCLRKGKDKFYFKDYGKTWALKIEELL